MPLPLKLINFLIISLVLSGCKLTIDVQGEGRVAAPSDSSIACEDECEYQSSLLKIVRLEAYPAEGYEFIGFDTTANGYVNNSSNFSYSAEYGLQLLPRDIGNPEKVPFAHSDAITAIFLPSAEIRQVYHGTKASCVWFNNDAVDCWGRTRGQPEAFSGIQAFSLMDGNACAIDSHGLRCWGESGAINNPPASITNPTNVVVNSSYACALYGLTDTDIACWGDIPEYADIPEFSNPTALWDATSQIGSDYRWLCAADDNGDQCWGEGFWGQAQVPEDLNNVTDIAAGESHTCAIADGEVVCWGRNLYGQLDVPDNLVSPTAIAVNAIQSCVLDNGEVVCWGSELPEVPTDLGEVTDLQMQGNTTCVRESNKVRCWQDSIIDYFEEEFVGLTQYSAGDNIIMVLDQGIVKRVYSTGTIFTYDQYSNPNNLAIYDHNRFCVADQAGMHCSLNNEYPPATQSADLLAVSRYHNCAVDSDQVYCWGAGQEADDWSRFDRGQSQPPEGLSNITKLSTGLYHSCVVADNEAVCWGEATVPQPN